MRIKEERETMKKRIVLGMIIFLLFLIILQGKCLAQSKMRILADKYQIKKEEEIELHIEFEETEVAALTLEIYWDNTKLEYIGGPENSNHSGNRVVYTWIHERGQNEANLSIGNFKFKAIEEGNVNIISAGEFYNANGQRVEVDNGVLEIKIGELEQNLDQVQMKNVSADNTNLSVLRLDAPGISPEFDPTTHEYYFITDSTVKDIELTAIPENQNAAVMITGNRNLRMGENVISIKVEAEDKSKTAEYKIYVTKTDNKELANANLETLAVKQGTLTPEFDGNKTRYSMEIANDVEQIDILAIPQKENASVSITGNDKMQIGDNKIEVVVLAENGTTQKKYELNVHRRNEEEEIQEQEANKVEAERLSAILETKAQDNSEQEEEHQNTVLIPIIIVIIGGLLIAGYIIYEKKIKGRK